MGPAQEVGAGREEQGGRDLWEPLLGPGRESGQATSSSPGLLSASLSPLLSVSSVSVLTPSSTSPASVVPPPGFCHQTPHSAGAGGRLVPPGALGALRLPEGAARRQDAEGVKAGPEAGAGWGAVGPEPGKPEPRATRAPSRPGPGERR